MLSIFSMRVHNLCIVIVLLTRWESEDGGTPVGKISIKPGQPGSGGPEVLFKVNQCTLPAYMCSLENLKILRNL